MNPSSMNKDGKPWRSLTAGLLLLGTAGLMMVYGAPAHASSHQAGAGHEAGAGSVRAELAGARLAPGAPALGGGEARYGVDVYRVTYRTVDANGRPVVASGPVAFPTESGTTAAGTSGQASERDGRAGGPVEGRWSAELFASAGFAVTEPVYMGTQVS